MTTADTSDSPLICALTKPATGAPLHIVPSAGSTPLTLVQLARAIDPPRQIYSFKAAGTEDGQEPHSTIEDMAEANNADILKTQPSGPYLIAGHCYGGVIALEMAAQLEKRGERVALLTLIDTFLPIGAEASGAPAGAPAGTLEVDMKQSEIKLREALATVHEQARQQLALVPQNVGQRFKRVLNLQIRAGLNYRCRPVQCPIALIRTPTHEDILFLNWASMSADGFTQIDIPGETFTILKPPQVESLGKRWGALLAHHS